MSSSRFSLGVSHGGGNRHVPDYGGEVAFDLVVGQTILENLVLLLPPILPMSCLAWATSHSSHFSFSSVNFVNGGMPLAFVPPPRNLWGRSRTSAASPFCWFRSRRIRTVGMKCGLGSSSTGMSRFYPVVYG